MPDAVTTMSHNWAFAVFLLGVFGLIAFMLGLSSLLGSKAWGRSKNDPFESGMLPVGSARLRLSAKFYLVAMLFVIFDVEVVFLFPWSTQLEAFGAFGLWHMFFFIFVLLLSLIYAWRKGVLRWA